MSSQGPRLRISSALHKELSASAGAKPKGGHPSTPPRRPPRTRTGRPRSGWTCTYAPRSQVMHQAREISPLTFPPPDGHLQGVQGQVGARWPVGGLPANDPPGVHVGHESHIDPPGERTHVGGAPPACGGMSATHSPPGAKASKWRLTRSPMSRTGGAPGHVTGTVTLGDLGSAPHHVHLAGPQNRVAGSYGPWISPLEGLVAQAPGARRPATAGVNHVLGTILTLAPVKYLADQPGPKLLLLGLDVLADQRDGRSHSAALDKLTRSLGSRWLFAALGPLSPAP